MKKCTIEYCGSKHYGRGYCNSHYKKLIRHGDPLFEKVWGKDIGCSIDGCTNKYFGKSYCQSHYGKWRKYGDALVTKRVDHGLSETAEYDAWIDMKKRCTKEYRKDYKHYGGRGIKVCEEWEHDFLAFLNHIGEKPTPKHSVDRIDVNKDYEPGNVRWATQTEQVRNRRLNHTNKSGVAGVAPVRGRWQSYIRVSGKQIYLGFYKDINEAIKARKAAEIKYWA